MLTQKVRARVPRNASPRVVVLHASSKSDFGTSACAATSLQKVSISGTFSSDRIGIRNPALPYPDVSNFMQKSEDLSCDGISTVYEDYRCERVGDREPAKFVYIESSGRITSHDSTSHNQDPFGLSALRQLR